MLFTEEKRVKRLLVIGGLLAAVAGFWLFTRADNAGVTDVSRSDEVAPSLTGTEPAPIIKDGAVARIPEVMRPNAKAADETHALAAATEEGAAISGHVYDEGTGNPVPGVTVVFWRRGADPELVRMREAKDDAELQVAVTDAAGWFTAVGFEPDIEYTCAAGGGGQAMRRERNVVASEVDLVLEVEHVYVCQIRVQTQDGVALWPAHAAIFTKDAPEGAQQDFYYRITRSMVLAGVDDPRNATDWERGSVLVSWSAALHLGSSFPITIGIMPADSASIQQAAHARHLSMGVGDPVLLVVPYIRPACMGTVEVTFDPDWGPSGRVLLKRLDRPAPPETLWVREPTNRVARSDIECGLYDVRFVSGPYHFPEEGNTRSITVNSEQPIALHIPLRTGGVVVSDPSDSDEKLGLHLLGKKRDDGASIMYYSRIIAKPPYELRGVSAGEYTLQVTRGDWTSTTEYSVTIVAGELIEIEL